MVVRRQIPRNLAANHWARRVLFYMVVSWLVSQCVAAWAFDYLLPRVRFETLHRLLDMMDDLPSSPDLLCLGSSRTGTSVQFDALTQAISRESPRFQAFNAGMPMGDPIVSEHVYDAIRKRGHFPKVVLIEVAPEFFQSPPGWLKEHVHRQMRWDETLEYWPEIVRSEAILSTAQERLAPWVAHRKGWWNWLGRQTASLRPTVRQVSAESAEDRYDRLRRDWDHLLNVRDDEQASEERNRQWLEDITKMLTGYSPDGLSVRALDRLIERCRAESATPVLVAMPVRSSVRSLHTESIEQRFQETLLRWTHPGEIPFWDFRDALVDDAFVDIQHASRAGGQRFTAILAERLRPWLRSYRDHLPE